MGPFNQNWPNNGQKVPKWPPKVLKKAVFHNLTPDYENSEFFSDKNGLCLAFGAKLSKTKFFAPKKMFCYF